MQYCSAVAWGWVGDLMLDVGDTKRRLMVSCLLDPATT
jgi:hypothetical protein